MFHSINVIATVDDGHPTERNWGKHEGITVHRCGVDLETGIVLGANAVEICAHFTGKDTTYPEVAAATGGQNAYTIMVSRAGQVWQCLPLSDIGHHARRWSYSTVGVAVIGDPRHEELTNAQYWALVDVCALLSQVYTTPPSAVRGHDEMQGGSRNPNKECPGDLLSMGQLRYDVQAVMQSEAERTAQRVGLVP